MLERHHFVGGELGLHPVERVRVRTPAVVRRHARRIERFGLLCRNVADVLLDRGIVVVELLALCGRRGSESGHVAVVGRGGIGRHHHDVGVGRDRRLGLGRQSSHTEETRNGEKRHDGATPP